MFIIAVYMALFGVLASAQQCYETVNSILSTGNAISPYTILLQLEFTQQAITSGVVTAPEAIRQACAGATDPDQTTFCTSLQSSGQGATIITQTAVGSLNALIDCVQAFINAAPDYQLSAGSYFNFPGTPPMPEPSSPSSSAEPTAVPSPVARSGGRKKRSSVFKTLASGDTRLDLSNCPLKSAFGLTSSKRQQSSCSSTRTCYTTCRSCQSRDAICEGAPVGTAATCGTVTDSTLRVAGFIALSAACTPLSIACGPGALLCNGVCRTFVPAILNNMLNNACAQAAQNACSAATTACNNCRAQNPPQICDPATSQCCPSETGTQCGIDCCCCPGGQAPRGPNCECVASP